MFSFKGQEWLFFYSTCSTLIGYRHWRPSRNMTSQVSERGHKVLGQLFILLQYQTVVHWLKVLILKADNLTNLTPGEITIHCSHPLPNGTLALISVGLIAIQVYRSCWPIWSPEQRNSQKGHWEHSKAPFWTLKQGSSTPTLEGQSLALTLTKHSQSG